jgi:hypothetical protein
MTTNTNGSGERINPVNPTDRHPIGQDFILGGRAIFTVANPQGDRFTFKVTRKDPQPGSRFTDPTYFVALMTGSNNETDYTYLGILKAQTGTVILTKGSQFAADHLAVKVAQWAVALVWKNQAVPAGYAIHHEGRCGRCGRTLTVPESIISGFGPDCTKLMGVKTPQLFGPDPVDDDAAQVFNQAHQQAQAAGADDTTARKAGNRAVTTWGTQGDLVALAGRFQDSGGDFDGTLDMHEARMAKPHLFSQAVR